ncbi:MAG TPA: cupin domain-containing protein [Ilumatobacteraceae bacterium]|nr:cupin domain-containing protein [Ilumatobacteraceae bacterium]
MSDPSIEAAHVVLPCPEPLSGTLNFFLGLGFKVRTIVPADHPRMAVMQGFGLTIRLDCSSDAPPAHLRLLTTEEAPRTLVAPNGSVIEFVPAHPPLEIPPLVEEFVLTRAPISDSEFGEGRAGMSYRDLIPSRLGGRFIASHILIPHGGPVADYVHFHNIRFQMIYCYRGWTRVAYEDQGEPILLQEGDCFLQPSTIRHRVLEASDRLQVIEIGCPAEHETWGDPATTLPTGVTLPDRGYGPDGHRFVFHQAATATWMPWRSNGYEFRDTGIGAAMDGVAGVRVVRPLGSPTPLTTQHGAEFVFQFVLDGGITLQRGDDEPVRLGEGDSFVMPAHMPYTLSEPTADLQLLDVSLPNLV